jgi:outer membrane protein assembly factor BamB
VTSAYLDLLAAYDMKLIVAGHTHANDAADDVVGKARQIVTTTSGAIPLDGAPRGFRTVEFFDGEVSSPFFELDAGRKATIVHPVGPVPWLPPTAVVSRYTPPGVPVEAEFRIPPQPWMPLQRFGRRAWRAPIADDDIGGARQLELRVRDSPRHDWTESAADFDVAEAAAGTPRMGAPWPMFHHDAQHSGRATDVVAPPLRLAWAEHVGGTVLTSSPAVVHDTVYLGVRDEDGLEANGVVALDVATGRRIWWSGSDSAVEGSVAVVGDLVLATSARGPLRALDAATGTVRWSWSPDHAGMPNCWMYFSPTIADGRVYQAYSVTSGTWLACLDAQTGREHWRTAQPVGRNWVSHASPAISGDLVTYASAYANLIGLDRHDGRLLWQTALGAGLGVHAKPVVAGGLIYLACRGDQLVAVEPTNGDVAWRYTSPGESSHPSAATGATPAVADGMIYAGFADGHVTAISLTDGEPLWSYRTEGPVNSSPAVSGDVLYVGSHDGRLRALDRRTGECIWLHDLGSWVASSPAVTGNAVVAATWDGTVYAFAGP